MNNWIDFWDKQHLIDDELWIRHIRHFYKASRDLLGFNQASEVLDIGCGHGFLAQVLKGEVKTYLGLDTSPRYVEECRERFKDSPFARFELLDQENYTDLSFLKGSAFTIMVLNSVVQYYADPSDLARLVASAKALAAPGAKMLVADIPMAGTGHLLKDVAGSLRAGIKSGSLGDKFRLFWNFIRSDYRRLRKTMLVYTPEDLLGAARASNLKAWILDAPLTTNPRRRHLLVEF